MKMLAFSKKLLIAGLVIGGLFAVHRFYFQDGGFDF